jgi:hypothetical protein
MTGGAAFAASVENDPQADMRKSALTRAARDGNRRDRLSNFDPSGVSACCVPLRRFDYNRGTASSFPANSWFAIRQAKKSIQIYTAVHAF